MLLMMLIILMMIIIITIIMMKIIAIVIIFHEGTKLAKFSAGPSNDMSGSLGFFILNQFSCLVEFHFHLFELF